ncbi:3'-5'-exoribonuclease [Malassezia yamatoensis]|uniref:3'-5'-exoribonuclease n=1 Tax=Malassezia yamatoensis TaxID=253288 RepID=A0AAJ5YRP2_9BASI|nr:3'-5'-exoribonuclease [Malassezia yamatoensis]
MTALYDRRRVNGPEESYLPLFDVEVGEPSQRNQPLWPLNEQRLIHDRSLQSQGQLQRTTVSLGQDNLALPRIAREDLSERAEGRGEQDSRPLWKDVESPSAAALVEQALLPAIRLDLLPKASIDVYVTILDLDTSVSGCIALAVTAASASLADAGIEMYGLVTGSSAISSTSFPYNGTVYQKWLVDPSSEEVAHASTDLLLCSMPAIGRTTCYSLQGTAYDFQELQKIGIALLDINKQVHSHVAQALQKAI